MHISDRFNVSSLTLWPSIAWTRPNSGISELKWPKRLGRSRSINIFIIKCDDVQLHVWYRFGDSSTTLHEELSCRHLPILQNGWNDLEDQGQSVPFSTPTRGCQGCMFGANLVVLIQICDDFVVQRSFVLGTDRWTAKQMDKQTYYAMTIPLQPDRLMGKKHRHWVLCQQLPAQGPQPIYLSKLPWIFPAAPLKVNRAPRNIQGNLTALTTQKACCKDPASPWTYRSTTSLIRWIPQLQPING